MSPSLVCDPMIVNALKTKTCVMAFIGSGLINFEVCWVWSDLWNECETIKAITRENRVQMNYVDYI